MVKPDPRRALADNLAAAQTDVERKKFQILQEAGYGSTSALAAQNAKNARAEKTSRKSLAQILKLQKEQQHAKNRHPSEAYPEIRIRGLKEEIFLQEVVNGTELTKYKQLNM